MPKRSGILIKITFIVLFLTTAGLNVSICSTPSGTDSHSSNKTKYKSLQSDTSKINTFIRKGYYYFMKKGSRPDLVKAYIDSAQSYCEMRRVYEPALLNLLNAEFSFQNGDFTLAEEQMKVAVDKAGITGENEVLVRSLLFEGRYFLRTGLFRESHDAYLKSIEISRKNNVKKMVPWGFEGIANLLDAAGDIKGFRNNLWNMIKEASELNDTLAIETALLRLGTSYDGADRNAHLADSLLRECLRISSHRKDTYFAGFSSANLGWNFYVDKLYDSSLFYYKKSLVYSQTGNHSGIIANSLGNIGTIYRDMGEYDLAKKFYERSVYVARVVSDYYTLGWVSDDINKLYLLQKDTTSAYRYYVLFKEYNDTVQLRKSNQGLLDARIRYEADMHNKEISLLSLRLKNNRILNIAFTCLILFIAVIAFLLVRGAKNEEKRRLSELNRQIAELTQANLRQQMNPHFIFNTLNSIQYYMFQHDKLATNEYLTKFSSLMRRVLENSQHTEVSLRDELDALNLYLELESLRFKDKFEYRITVDDEIDPLLYKVPTMLIQPYVENSICHGLKHADGKGIVSIDIRLGRKQLICTIEDNGIGREEARKKVEAEGGNHNSLGTRITGSRLNLVNSLYGTTLKTVYTDLKNEDGTPGGTRVEIQIPIIT
jgi:tetratricopeptide (TPR) repeat protein